MVQQAMFSMLVIDSAILERRFGTITGGLYNGQSMS